MQFISQIENGCQAMAVSLLVILPHRTLRDSAPCIEARLLCYATALSQDAVMTVKSSVKFFES